MLNIAICDDEKYYLEKLEKLIVDSLHLKGISLYKVFTYSSGVEFCKQESEILKYDVIFLDINMPEKNGLETARKIREYSHTILIVFVTAFIDYSLEGYKLEVARFLLKDMLDNMFPECIEYILNKLKIQAKYLQYFFLEGKKELAVDQLYYIESQKHKLIFYVGERKQNQYSLYDKLDSLEDELSQYGFLRIHKSYLVNLQFIHEIANYKVKLKNGKLLPVPREKYQQVKETYYEMMGEFT